MTKEGFINYMNNKSGWYKEDEDIFATIIRASKGRIHFPTSET